MTKHIPNFLTLCNLACGCYGIVMVFNGDVQTGSVMIWAGAVFDFFDGFSARVLNKFSSIGKDLDSFADIITFCFLPASILYILIEQGAQLFILPFFGFLLVLFGALRLAKFNNDTRQPDFFYGLPVPASGIFVSAFPFISNSGDSDINSIITSQYSLIGIAVLLSLMMISDIKLMSLKFKNFSFQANWYRYVLIITSLFLIVFIHIVALPIIILLYVVLSIALNIAE